DGVTDIYGVMWKPFDFDPNRKYPIIAHVYPGPQTESVTANFSPTNGNQRLAQLGFVVIQIGNRGGNPRRSNAYHSYGYYNLRDYGLADKKAGIEQLAARHRYIDVDKVGIYGHSGGGFMTAAAMMLPPYNEFFKVGVSSAGNHDNNIYNQNWSEQHHGLREVRVPVNSGASTTGANRTGGAAGAAGRAGGEDPESQGAGATANGQRLTANASEGAFVTKFEIKVPTTTELAPNLVGKLLLVHGDMDNNVHPGNTIRLANALIKANKRFDFMLMPGKAHGFGDMQNYFTQMMYEYFAEHLLGDYYRGTADMKSKGK
ncbi:MAG TPA: prolyl oligopeptidase family serine peptidase, partial [Fimbriimonadaceae bacterium]|nr:prolyl oligopeptidase family serine peptidase [Fimbriimonadaceae bacterium]